MSAPVTMQTALQIIRTWAAFERDHPEMHVLVPEHVLKICDEALGIDSEEIDDDDLDAAIDEAMEKEVSND